MRANAVSVHMTKTERCPGMPREISISASPSKQKRSSNPAQSKNVPITRFPPITALRNKVLANKVKVVKDLPIRFSAYQHSSHWLAGSHN
jgi:hypothetical protein